MIRVTKNPIVLGKFEGSRKKAIPRMRWLDSLKEALAHSLEDLNEAINCSILGRSLIPGVAINLKCLDST